MRYFSVLFSIMLFGGGVVFSPTTKFSPAPTQHYISVTVHITKPKPIHHHKPVIHYVAPVYHYKPPTTPSAPKHKPQPPQNGKCQTNCTNPNANYFDVYGNEFNYKGQLIHAACADGYGNSPNPYCNCPTGYYVQGNYRDRGGSVCNKTEENASPMG